MKLFTIAALLIFSAPCGAQTLPDAPKPKTDHRIFVIGTAALAGAKMFDVQTTRSLLARGGWENNSMIGRHPSDARLAGHAAAYFAAESTVFYFTERSSHRWIRWTGRIGIAFVIEEHFRLGACNSRIDPHSDRVQNCRALF